MIVLVVVVQLVLGVMISGYGCWCGRVWSPSSLLRGSSCDGGLGDLGRTPTRVHVGELCGKSSDGSDGAGMVMVDEREERISVWPSDSRSGQVVGSIAPLLYCII